MFDISLLTKRFFEIKVGETTLGVEPPKLKTLRKLSRLSSAATAETSSEEEAMEALAECVAAILNKNREGIKIDAEFVEGNFDIDQMRATVREFFGWLNAVQQSKN